MSEWKYWTPERDGHAPDDWVEGMEIHARGKFSTWGPLSGKPHWLDCSEYRYRPLQDATVEPDWIEWNGGECPVPPDTIVEVQLRDKVLTPPRNNAGWWRWAHRNWRAADDIIAYRVVSNPTIKTVEPDLLTQCLALPKEEQQRLIEAMQEPVRDWADDIAEEAWRNYDDNSWDGIANHLRSKCLPKDDPLLTEIFDFLGSVDGSGSLRDKIMKLQHEALS